MAAGAAGVIKTALSLALENVVCRRHCIFVPAIRSFPDLPKSTFCRQCEFMRPWTTRGGPLRAGVSSFGVGGTNAHVILEEPPSREASVPANGPQLLLLSARTDTALGNAAARLGDHIAALPDSNLADVAWTLCKGRKVFAHRAHVVVENGKQAIARLRDVSAAAKTALNAAPGIVFMFPGQGSQYAALGPLVAVMRPSRFSAQR